jgi:hypothetical protein
MGDRDDDRDSYPPDSNGYCCDESCGCFTKETSDAVERARVVGVLDAYMATGGRIDLACIDGKWDLELYGKGGSFTAAYTEPSADAARAAAAKAIESGEVG